MDICEPLFRREYGRLVAALTRVLGDIERAEESVQEAFVRAVRVWPLRGVPDDPAAWLLQTARNHAIDEFRRTKLSPPPRAEPQPDDPLEMMFLCCHPSLSREDQVAMILNAVAGFGASEISRAFFLTEAAVAQRLVRAKRKLVGVPLRLGSDVHPVLDALYLVFNEGYTIRAALMEETIRLMELLVRHPIGDVPEAHALFALMLFQSSRIAAREGLVPLPEQDRSLWDMEKIDRALRHLDRARGDTLSEYHLLAGIAAVHATTGDFQRIVELYDALMKLNPGRLVRLNRAVAISYAEGPEAGLRLLGDLEDGHHLAAARADCLRRLGCAEEARKEYARAADLAPTEQERAYFLDLAT